MLWKSAAHVSLAEEGPQVRNSDLNLQSCLDLLDTSRPAHVPCAGKQGGYSYPPPEHLQAQSSTTNHDILEAAMCFAQSWLT